MNRDILILNMLFEQKVIEQSSIYSMFFKGRARKTCIRRMQKLVQSGYIRKQGVPQDNSKLKIVYSLTEHGFSQLRKNLSLASDNATFRSDTIMHDTALSDFRIKLTGLTEVESFYSENAIKNLYFGEKDDQIEPFRRLNTDAVLELYLNQSLYIVGLEYERLRKNEAKYFSKIRDYYLESSAVAVCYICKDKSVLELIRKIDKKVNLNFKSKKIYTILEKDFQKSKDKLSFFNSDNGILSIQ